MTHHRSRTRATKRPQPIARVIDKVMRSLGHSRNYDGWRVVSHWPDIVGEYIARKARAIRFSDGVLYVAVQDAVWRQELAMRIEEILTAIRRSPGGQAVKRVRLIMGERGTDPDGD